MALQRIGNEIISGTTVNGNYPVYNNNELVDSGTSSNSVRGKFPDLIFSHSFTSNGFPILGIGTPPLTIVPITIANQDLTSEYVDFALTEDSVFVARFTTKYSGLSLVRLAIKIQMETIPNASFADGFSFTINPVVNGAKLTSTIKGSFDTNYISPSITTSTGGLAFTYPTVEFMYNFSTGDTFRFESFWSTLGTSGSLPGPLSMNANSTYFPRPTGGGNYGSSTARVEVLNYQRST